MAVRPDGTQHRSKVNIITGPTLRLFSFKLTSLYLPQSVMCTNSGCLLVSADIWTRQEWHTKPSWKSTLRFSPVMCVCLFKINTVSRQKIMTRWANIGFHFNEFICNWEHLFVMNVSPGLWTAYCQFEGWYEPGKPVNPISFHLHLFGVWRFGLMWDLFPSVLAFSLCVNVNVGTSIQVFFIT